jgi:hypothetical protein
MYAQFLGGRVLSVEAIRGHPDGYRELRSLESLPIGDAATFAGVPATPLAVSLPFQPEPMWCDNLVLKGSLHVLGSFDGEMGYERGFLSDFKRYSELAVAPVGMISMFIGTMEL